MQNNIGKKLNFVFWGTPDVASETLQILKESGYLPSLIITSPDRPQGRKMLLTPPPVKVWAIENNIPYVQSETNMELCSIFSSDESIDARRDEKKLKKAEYDLFVVVAYGKIIREDILNIPKFGSINIHYSLLPKYRGASPVESAILSGDTETGVTIQKMVYEMDAGDIIAQEKIEILFDEKAFELRARLISLGGELLVKTLPDFMAGKIKPTPQDERQASVCKKIKKEDGLVDLGVELPNVLYNKFRAYAKWPRTFFFQNSKRMVITKARLENDKFVIEKVIPEGKKETDYKN